eukprot:CAMPEP_0177670880 /NCGR_PEP_ID=MMETSP0447-20121125/24353_1 /TAXON_ID=0 /ORGANISM="Stygamoeba regulata, Strain BSH-02190019" /LENGTH=30 /DNA_ID= /DNA_START= /DNA_END= /DNA_ORIENTATION=
MSDEGVDWAEQQADELLVLEAVYGPDLVSA